MTTPFTTVTIQVRRYFNCWKLQYDCNQEKAFVEISNKPDFKMPRIKGSNKLATLKYVRMICGGKKTRDRAKNNL